LNPRTFIVRFRPIATIKAGGWMAGLFCNFSRVLSFSYSDNPQHN
jgi:hypothetical protein